MAVTPLYQKHQKSRFRGNLDEDPPPPPPGPLNHIWRTITQTQSSHNLVRFSYPATVAVKNSLYLIHSSHVVYHFQ